MISFQDVIFSCHEVDKSKANIVKIFQMGSWETPQTSKRTSCHQKGLGKKRCYYHAHFTDRRTEAKRSTVICLMSHIWLMTDTGFEFSLHLDS